LVTAENVSVDGNNPFTVENSYRINHFAENAKALKLDFMCILNNSTLNDLNDAIIPLQTLAILMYSLISFADIKQTYNFTSYWPISPNPRLSIYVHSWHLQDTVVEPVVLSPLMSFESAAS